MKEFVCQTCGKTFESRKSYKSLTPKFCGKECYAESLRKYKTCQYCGKVFADYTREKYCSRQCRIDATKGVPLTEEHRKKLSEARKASPKCHGESLYNWKGGEATYLERMRAHNETRRTALKKPVDRRYLRALRFVQRNRCFYCGCDMGKNATIEHLTPVSRGGDNDWWNIVYACKSCNSKKKNKTMEEYAIHTDQLHLFDKYDITITNARLLYDKRH